MMTDAEKIHRLTRALEAIAGYSHIPDRVWREHYPELAKPFPHEPRLGLSKVANFAFNELKCIQDYKWTFEDK